LHGNEFSLLRRHVAAGEGKQQKDTPEKRQRFFNDLHSKHVNALSSLFSYQVENARRS
jgi:hypothetical protein